MARLPETRSLELTRGLATCRRGRWREGLALLSAGAAGSGGLEGLPAAVLSNLAYALARCEGCCEEALTLCRWAIEREPFVGEHYLNLARIHLLSGDRERAFSAVRKGLEVDGSYRALQGLLKQLGVRRPQVVPFLPRSHSVNRMLGRLRFALAR